jgi:hypothetical protein
MPMLRGAEWDEAALLVLHIDPIRQPARARRAVLLRCWRVTAIKRKQHDPINSNKELKSNARRACDEGRRFLD